MYQLIIIIPDGVNMTSFDQDWPEFLAAAEKMPGLIKESLTRVNQWFFGSPSIQRIYCFDFADRDALRAALVSEPGEKAGEILHRITGGKVAICAGFHQSDLLDHIHSH